MSARHFPRTVYKDVFGCRPCALCSHERNSIVNLLECLSVGHFERTTSLAICSGSLREASLLKEVGGGKEHEVEGGAGRGGMWFKKV